MKTMIIRTILLSGSLLFGTFFSFQLSAQQRYTPELLWKLGRVSEVQVSPDQRQLLYGITWYDLQANKGNCDLYLQPVKGGQSLKVTSFNGSESNGIFRPDGKKIAFLSSESGSSQIWEADPDGSKAKRISGIDGDITGFSYSPDGTKILFSKRVKLDMTPNDRYPDLPKANARIEDDLMYRHWDSWSDYSYSHIFVAPYTDGAIGQPKDIMYGERYDSPMLPWGGMEQICWSPDGQSIAYTSKKMTGLEYSLSTNSDIYMYNVVTGTTNNISERNRGYDQDPVFSPDGSKIVWRSMERDGFEADKDRIMMYDVVSGSMKDYSAGFDQSSKNFVWSSDGKTLWFISGHHGTEQIYSLDLSSGAIQQLTSGDHDYVSINSAGNELTGIRQSMLEPSEIFRISPQGAENQISFINKEILSNVKSASVKSRWITTMDGKKMLVWIILPPDFDPKKKYPTLLFCEGGPQNMVSQFFSYRWNFQMMAANDYIVVAPNRRGLPGFGQEWNDQISGDYGGQNMKDYLTAIDSVAAEPYVDKDRLGAVGASYGGFSVLWLAGHHEGRFKAFISHCGMFNLEDQYLTTEEMW
ncbi:MAG TPA: alpha/beta fold hydrolase, partial [Bacteroidales bacterium]|nr:alpha/beta fold hydrolase [Bacteroidales bacterium]